jgi:membrane protein DedA with SNARE-associated domain
MIELGAHALWQAAALATGTLVSEDLACAAAGQLVAVGRIHWVPAVAGCFAGIYVGDLLLWLAGRVFGRGLLRWPWLRRRAPEARLRRLGDWFDRRGAAAIVAARFLPGTRLPLYVAAGAFGRKGGRFALWTFLAAAAWTPAVVLLASRLGSTWTAGSASLPRPVHAASAAASLLAIYFVLRVLPLLFTEVGRARLIAAASRLWRWEFWPAWLFYLPAVPWIAWQSLRRGGLSGFASITAANPGIPLGGFVGESKFDILRHIAGDHVLSAALIEPGDPSSRVARLELVLRDNGWSFPLVLKPDVGQRGAGVTLARSPDDARRFLAENPAATLVQVYHPGPYEAGVFYYRLPDESAGHIFSITDKVFPEMTGDGVATVERLIWRHPRYRMQARVHLARHAEQLDRVPAAGERLRLSATGNHCQGTLFRDGSHLITPELAQTIDRIARRFDGFYFGRFDVRYSDADAFKAGVDLAVVELNGVTSESTNLYDPDNSLLQAYRTLISQWEVLFRVADANRLLGRQVAPTTHLATAVAAHVIPGWKSPGALLLRRSLRNNGWGRRVLRLGACLKQRMKLPAGRGRIGSDRDPT